MRSGPDWRRYLRDRVVRIGLAIVIGGAAPLIVIIVLAAVGVWPDPNPNPIGPGLLLLVTFWPGVITAVIGIVRVRARDRRKA